MLRLIASPTQRGHLTFQLCRRVEVNGKFKMSHLDLVADHSKEKLVEVPDNLLSMTNLKMLFLEGNFLSRLPEDMFWRMPMLMWLDLRNNLLESIPRSIANHQNLENLLLTNNNIERLPNELGRMVS